jgi:hypothetical protein
MNEDSGLDYYMEIGAVEVVGVDEFGELIFRVTDKAELLAPDLWEAHTKHIDESLIDLYNKGYVNVTYDDDLNAIIELSEDGKKTARELGIITVDQNEI